MTDQSLHFPWGNNRLTLTLPDTWQVAGILEPASLPPAPDPQADVQRALAQPVGMPRLSDLIRPGLKVTIVIDDGSRPTPVAQILPEVLRELGGCGVTPEQITVVPALGVHRAMEDEEMRRRAGGMLDGLKWENPDCDNLDQLVFLGQTSRGTPVWINRTVARADLVVSIGCIEPHIIASYGGGYKNIIPGVAGRATIAHNHAINCTPGTFNMVGQSIERNPMRLDLEEAAGKLAEQKHAPQVFIVNAILNHCKEVVQIVAGDPVAAHRRGVGVCAGLYSVKVSRPADIVITASHPMDQDLRQGVKALANTVRAVKPGGIMITLVRAEEGVGVFGLANRKLPLGRGAMKTLAPLLLKLVPKMKLKGVGEEDRFFLYFALQAMRHARLLMYGPTIPAMIQERLPFVEFVGKPEEAIRLAAERFKGRAEVLVFPHGGITYPDLG